MGHMLPMTDKEYSVNQNTRGMYNVNKSTLIYMKAFCWEHCRQCENIPICYLIYGKNN
uniref:Uncharacterized protein n=1 Tax=Octopus bimaculoides TaxID=37653 RepID=A0A0L8FXA7_OCTBM